MCDILKNKNCRKVKCMLNFYIEMPQNIEKFKKNNYQLNLTAEKINDCFKYITEELIKIEYEDFDTIEVFTSMLNSSFHSWILAYTFSMAKLGDTAYSELRKSIEFLCYSSKVINNSERIRQWLNQQKDESARKLFSRECSIPMAYTNNKYKFLWPLLMIYDHTCYYGTHANVEIMSRKKARKINKKLFFDIYTDDKFILLPTAVIVQCGFKIIKGYQYLLINSLQIEISGLNEMVCDIDNELKKARMIIAFGAFKGKMPNEVISTIENNTEDIGECENFINMVKNKKKS